MNKFTVRVKFRKVTNFTRHNIAEGSEITGVIDVITDRCDLVPILSDYNVSEYQIVGCDNNNHVMSKPETIPEWYYEDP